MCKKNKTKRGEGDPVVITDKSTSVVTVYNQRR